MNSRTCVGALALAFLVAGCQSTPRLEEIPPAPPIAPRAPPPPATVQVPGPWGIYFDLDRIEIRKVTLPILNEVVANYGRVTNTVVTVDGHGDTTGHSQYNLELGQRRAEAVKDWLVSHGIPRDHIRTVTDGERDPLVRTGDDVLERRNRRVEIRFGPPTRS